MRVRIEEMGEETRLRIARASRGERPAGQTSCHGMKKDELFFFSGRCDAMATAAPERGLWDVFKKFMPTRVTPPVAVPLAHAFDNLQELSTRDLRKRAFDSFYADDLVEARNCYLLLLVREPGQDLYHQILAVVVDKIRSRQDAELAGTYAA